MEQTSTIHFCIVSLFCFFVVSLGVVQLTPQRALHVFSLFLFSLDILDVLHNLLLLYLRSACSVLEMGYLYGESIGSHLICGSLLRLLRLQWRQVAETLYRFPKQDLHTSPSHRGIL